MQTISKRTTINTTLKDRPREHWKNIYDSLYHQCRCQAASTWPTLPETWTVFVPLFHDTRHSLSTIQRRFTWLTTLILQDGHRYRRRRRVIGYLYYIHCRYVSYVTVLDMANQMHWYIPCHEWMSASVGSPHMTVARPDTAGWQRV